MILVLFSAIILIAVWFLTRHQQVHLKIFTGMTLATAFYYSAFGPAYWIYIKDGVFLGVDWIDLIPVSSIMFSMAMSVYILLTWAFCNKKSSISLIRSCEFIQLPVSYIVLMMVGAGSMMAVLAAGSSRGPLFLTFYQFSDVTVAVIVYGLVADSNRRRIYALLAFYVFYTIIVGFRYKLILAFYPVWMYFLFKNTGKIRLYISIFPPLIMALIFSVMTFTRVKFGGLDVSGMDGIVGDDVLYGFFAESNIIFGVCSVIEGFLFGNQDFVYFVPLVDTIKEMFPRFLVGDRITGERIWTVLSGLYTVEGYNSATTYPFFAEYIMMGGYPGLILGLISISMITSALINWLIENSQDSGFIYSGVGLLAVLFGYYGVSRGYLPQFFKSIVYVYAPFAYMVNSRSVVK